MENKTKSILQISNLISFIATVFINFLAATLPIGLGDTGELSDAIPNLFVPAGLTFSIWSVIYLLLLVFNIYQIRDIGKSEKIPMPFLSKIGYLFVISGIANIIWIFLWHYKLILLSAIVMLVILVLLILIYTRLGIGKEKIANKEKFAVHTPFSVYLGWITVATIANFTAVFVTLGVESFGFFAELMTVLVIAVAVAITSIMLLKRNDFAYGIVVLWAILGIYLKQMSSNMTVAVTALVALILIALVIVYSAIKKAKSK